MTRLFGSSRSSKRGTLDVGQVVGSAGTTMFVVDPELTITHISDATLEALGYQREEVVGKMTCADMCPSSV